MRSIDLAELLNDHEPLTDEDAAETPLDWGGITFIGPDGLEKYDIDIEASSATRCVLKGVNAAAEYKTSFHNSCPLRSDMPSISAPHWCPAVYEKETYFGGEGVVILDWRSVYLGHGDFAETDELGSLEGARQRFDEQCEYLRTYEQEENDEGDDEEFVGPDHDLTGEDTFASDEEELTEDGLCPYCTEPPETCGCGPF